MKRIAKEKDEYWHNIIKEREASSTTTTKNHNHDSILIRNTENNLDRDLFSEI